MPEQIDLTEGGRLLVHPYVNEAKYLKMKELVEESMRGGFAAERAALAARESLAAHDGAFSLAHLMTVQNLEGFDEAERNWDKIATVETVDDFEPVTFQAFTADFENLEFGKGTKGNQVSPKVAEGDTYQYAYGYTEEAVKAAITKRGFKFGLTLEKLIGNFRRYIRDLPGDMLEVALETDEFLVFDRLQTSALAANRITADVNPITGAAIPADPAPTADGIRAGLRQISLRKRGGKSVPLAARYWVVVQLGAAEAVEAEIAKAKSLQQVILDANGSISQVLSAPPLGNLGRIAGVIESPYILEDGRWFLAPAAGSTRRKGLVKLQLAGRTSPEVLVNNFTGTPIAGSGGSSPFDLAHFDNDTVDLKLRQFTDSALITQDQMAWSLGTGE